MLFIDGFSIHAVNLCLDLLISLFDLFSYRFLVLLFLLLFTVGMLNHFLGYVWSCHFLKVYFWNWLSLLNGLLIVRNLYLSSFTFFNLCWCSLRWVDFINYILNEKYCTWCSGFSSRSPPFGLLRANLLESLKLDVFLLFIFGYSL